MYRYDRAEVVFFFLLFLDQSDFKVMPSNRRFKQRIKGSATSVVASSFELNQRVLLIHLVSGLDRLFIRQLRPQSDI
jgi:hypothetical protein